MLVTYVFSLKGQETTVHVSQLTKINSQHFTRKITNNTLKLGFLTWFYHEIWKPKNCQHVTAIINHESTIKCTIKSRSYSGLEFGRSREGRLGRYRESQRVRFPSRWPLFFSIFGLVCQSSVLAVFLLAVSSIPSAIKKGTTFLCEIGYCLLQGLE